MLATLLVSGLVSRLCLAGPGTGFPGARARPGAPQVPGKLFVRNQKWLMPSFSIRVEAVRDPAAPTLKSGVYFPLIAGGATVEETVEVCFPRRGAYRENSFAFSTCVPVRLSGEIGARHAAPRNDRLPLDRSAAGLRRPASRHHRRDRNALPRARQGLLPHPALRSVRERAPRRLESHGARRQPAGARVRARAGADRRDFSRSRHPARWTPGSSTPSIAARFLLAALEPGRVHPLPLQRLRFRQPEEGDIYTILKIPGVGAIRRLGNAPEPPLDETSYKIVFTPRPAVRATRAGAALACLLLASCPYLPGRRRPRSEPPSAGAG